MNKNTANLQQSSNSIALLAITAVRLVLPQNDIRSLESAADIDAQHPQPDSVGWIAYAAQTWPVYCLTANLQLLANIPTERRACVLLSSGSGYIGILCDAVQIARQIELGTAHELPTAMHQPFTPVLGLVNVNDGQVGCLTSAKQLVAHIHRQVSL